MDKKVIVGGAGALAAVGAIIVGVANHKDEAPVQSIVKVVCKSKDVEKEYDTKDGSTEKKGESVKMIAPNGQPFYFDGDCAIKK